MTPLNLAILISGRGSNMRALVTASQQADYPARPALILANRPDAQGLAFATEQGIPAVCIDHKPYGSDREAFESAMQNVLLAHRIDMIALAGFMRILTPWFVTRWQGKMINIHPSLLPKYPGLNTHARAIEAGDDRAGCTVHWVSEGVDQGQIIKQQAVPIQPGDTPSRLAERVLEAEHQLYPMALKRAAAHIQQQNGPD